MRGRRRRCCRSGVGRGCGRRLGRCRRVGGSPRRKERERVDVGVAGALTDAEVDVCGQVLHVAGWAGLRDHVALGNCRAATDAQCPGVRQRHLVLTERDRHRQSVRRNRTRERDLTGRRSANRRGASERDVDSSMLTCGVGVRADREALEDLAVDRPCPGPCRRPGDERAAPDHGEARHPPRCPSSEHGTTVPRGRVSGNAL